MPIVRNPLSYWCAPNGATPDYVSAHRPEDFIGYALIKSCFDPEDDMICQEMRDLLDESHTQELREEFLGLFEDVVLGYYEGIVGPDADEEYEHSPDLGVHVGSSDDGDKCEFRLEWHFDAAQDDALMFSLMDYTLVGNFGPSDPQTIWIDYDALEDRAAVKAALDKANEALGVRNEYRERLVGERWVKALAEQPSDEEE